MKRKAGVTVIEVIEAASCSIFVQFHSQRARWKHDVARACGLNSVRSKDAPWQWARTSSMTFAPNSSHVQIF